MGQALGEGGVPVGAAVGDAQHFTNAAVVNAVAAGAAQDVIVQGFDPAGRAEGGSVRMLVIAEGQVDGAAVNAQQAIFTLDANIAGAGFANLTTQEVEKVLAGTVNHDAWTLSAIIVVPRGDAGSVPPGGVIVRVQLAAIGQNQDIAAGDARMMFIPLST